NQTTQLIQLVLHISLQPLERHTPLHAIQNHLRKAQELRPHLLNQIYHGRPHLLSTSVLVHCQDGEVFFRFLPLPTLSYSNVTLSTIGDGSKARNGGRRPHQHARPTGSS